MTNTHSKDTMENFNEESNSKARGERLQKLRGMANLSRSDMEQYDISANTLKNWELARQSGLTKQGAQKIVAVFKQLGIQCSTGWLLEGTGPSPIFLDTPVSYDVSATHQGYVLAENGLPPEINLFCETRSPSTYLKIVDDSMEPFYCREDYVAGETYHSKDIESAIGKCCIVEMQNGEILLRFVRHGSKKDTYSLYCVNPLTSHEKPFVYNAKLLSAAPVMLHLKFGVRSQKVIIP